MEISGRGRGGVTGACVHIEYQLTNQSNYGLKKKMAPYPHKGRNRKVITVNKEAELCVNTVCTVALKSCSNLTEVTFSKRKPVSLCVCVLGIKEMTIQILQHFNGGNSCLLSNASKKALKTEREKKKILNMVKKTHRCGRDSVYIMDGCKENQSLICC